MNELSLHVMDIIQNSIDADSTIIQTKIQVDEAGKKIIMVIKDNGYGMDKDTLRKVVDPFYTSRTTREIGLGISMFKGAAELSGGDFDIASQKGLGTQVTATFNNHSIDRQPMGNIGNVFFLLLLSHSKIDMKLELASTTGSFIFCSKPFIKAVVASGESNMEAAFKSETLINNQLQVIFQGILPELEAENETK
ncbi:MAG: sensor histidine kinase [Anaerovoracaceae bacterium]